MCSSLYLYSYIWFLFLQKLPQHAVRTLWITHIINYPLISLLLIYYRLFLDSIISKNIQVFLQPRISFPITSSCTIIRNSSSSAIRLIKNFVFPSLMPFSRTCFRNQTLRSTFTLIILSFQRMCFSCLLHHSSRALTLFLLLLFTI